MLKTQINCKIFIKQFAHSEINLIFTVVINQLRIIKMKAQKFFGKEKTLVEIEFTYSESCRNVYKHFSVYRNGKKSNIRGLLRFLENKNYPEILTQNCYFWHPASVANMRRRNEEKRNDEVVEYFISEGFEIL
jgi:hypothetical protein